MQWIKHINKCNINTSIPVIIGVTGSIITDPTNSKGTVNMIAPSWPQNLINCWTSMTKINELIKWQGFHVYK